MMGTVLIAALLALVLILALPIEVRARVVGEVRQETRVSVRLLGGLVEKELKRTGGAPASKEPKPRPPRRAKKSRRRGGARHFLTAMQARGFAEGAWRLVRRLWSGALDKQAAVRARVGLEDPAETGMLWACLGSGLALLPPEVDVRVEPDFSGERLEYLFEGAVRAFPLKVLVYLVAFLLTPSTWRGFMALAGWR